MVYFTRPQSLGSAASRSFMKQLRRLCCCVGVGLVLAPGSGVAGPVLDAPSGLSIDVLPADSEKIPELASAVAAVKRRDAAQALKSLTEAAKGRTDLPPPRVMLGAIQLSDTQTADARVNLEQGIIESPEHPFAYIILANMCLAEGFITAAQLQFDKAGDLLTKKGGNDPRSKQMRFMCQLGLATVAERRQQWPAAREALRAASEVDPTHGQTRQRYGAAIFHTGEEEKAYAELQKAFEQDNKLLPPPVSMGLLYAQRQDDPKTEEWLRKAVAEHPKDARGYQALGLFLVQRNRAAEAKQMAEKALELEPKSVETHKLVGAIAFAQRDFAQAEQHYEAAYAAAPSDVNASNALALALVEQTSDSAKRLRALQLAEMNCRQYPNQPVLLATLGWVHFRMQHLNEAKRFLSSAIAGGQGTPEMFYYYAHILQVEGQREPLIELLKQLATARSAFPYREDVQGWLERLGVKPEDVKKKPEEKGAEAKDKPASKDAKPTASKEADKKD